MAVTHLAAAMNAATDAVLALLGAGAQLAFRLAGTVGSPGAVAALLNFSATAFGASSAGTATANAITTNTSVTGNASPVATATFQTSGGTVVVHCAVAASASDINVTNGLTFAAGDTVSCTSLTYKALAA